jgi:hypothetical protein
LCCNAYPRILLDPPADENNSKVDPIAELANSIGVMKSLRFLVSSKSGWKSNFTSFPGLNLAGKRGENVAGKENCD